MNVKKKDFERRSNYVASGASAPHVPALISAGTNETCMDAPPISSTPIVFSCLINKHVVHAHMCEQYDFHTIVFENTQ
jgi:hypothetical protein